MLSSFIFFLTLSYERPWVFYAIPIMLILLALLLRYNVVPLKNLSAEQLKKRKRQRFWGRTALFCSRGIIFVLLLIAIAGPYYEDSVLVNGEPRVIVLTDDSNSMAIYDQEIIDPFLNDLRARVPVETYSIGAAEESNLGDTIISHMEENTPMLLISDGQVTSGTPLSTVVQFATGINSSLSALELPVSTSDVSVSLLGPSKALEDVENEFFARVTSQQPTTFTINVKLDGKTVVSERGSIGENEQSVEYAFTSTFADGDHSIVATVTAQEDTFEVNNVAHKTVHVVEKPSLLVIAKQNTPTLTLLKEIYDVTVLNDFPDDVSKYGAIILHDQHADTFDKAEMELISDYLVDGNGLLVLGGLNSFDLGEYEQSQITSYLPVKIGSGEERESDSHVILLIDISSSTGGGFRSGGKYSVSDVIKAQAISLLGTLKDNDKVGIVAFNDRAYLISPLSPLGDKKDELIDKIARLRFENGTFMNVGLMASYQVLREVSGGKSVVVLSDGRLLGYAEDTLLLARKMAQGNMHVYSVGIGAGTDVAFMKSLAREGNGIYFEPSEFQKLKILFGEPELLKTEGLASYVVLNDDHFITRGIELNAKVGAYNSVVPKSTAQTLVTLETGEPALSVWHHGLGRVAAFTAFTTNNDLGALVNKDNSKFITRMVNWVIGDPERNSEYFVSVDDTRIGAESYVRVRSEKIPSVQGMSFYRDETGDYASSFVPTEMGIFPMLTTTYGVNAPAEYGSLGVSEELERAVFESEGQFFTTEETASLVEFLKKESTRIQVEKVNYMKELLIIALIIFILEVMIRRVYETWIKGRY